jgi:hypothetical protein
MIIRVMIGLGTPSLTAIVMVAWLATAGCKRNVTPATAPEPAAAGGARDAPAAGAQSPPPSPAGMKAPFERRTPALAKSFVAGVKAYRAKKYGEAERLFHQVVAARPDDTAARYQELRAAVRADPDADLREPLRALLFRDFVGYDHLLRTAKELASLWASPRASELEAIRAAARAAYADRLAQGAFFVGRNRTAQPVVYDETGRPVIDLYQEAYAFDPGSGLVRRLSDTTGRVAGIKVDRGGKRLVLLIINGVAPTEGASGLSFSAVAGMTVSLQTLERVGPIAVPIEEPVAEIGLCTTAKGEARWAIGQMHYAIDATKRRAVVVRQDDCAPGTTAAVTPEHGRFVRPAQRPPDASVINLPVDGGTRPIALAAILQSGPIEWSPGRSRLAFTRAFDPCSLEWPTNPMNNLYLWDRATAKTVRLATAFSFFEWEWLDDDRLVYEASGPKGGKIVVHDFRTQTDATLEVPSGAGLCAAPSFDCVDPGADAPGTDDDDGAE